MMDDAGRDEPLEGPGPGRHPLIGRQSVLVRALRWLGLAAWALAIGGVLLPGDAGRVSAVALVVLLIAAPIFRIAWLCVRWVRRGDPKFALLAAVLIVIVTSGGLLAA